MNWAQLDENNTVVRVVVANSLEWLTENLGGVWVECNIPELPKTRASAGFIYDVTERVFFAPKPFDSWILDEPTHQWVATVPYPQDDKDYTWDEEAGNWGPTEHTDEEE